MATVLELLTLTTDYFTKKEIESPRLNAELLLSHVLECRRLDLYLWYDKPIGESEVNAYREFVRQRGSQVPLQYITGETDFYGMRFKVNKSALIPRPDTEILVEKVIEFAKGMDAPKILDIGTGSGNIAISLAMQLPASFVTAIDISEEALTLAKENAAVYNLANHVQFLKMDITDANIALPEQYDIIVSNPPYVSLDEYALLKKEIVSYEPKGAVTDYGDGLKFYKIISKLAQNSLVPCGVLFFEMGYSQALDINAILQANDFSEIEIFKDYQGIERVIRGKKP